MTAPDSSSPAPTEPSDARPRLVINGVPVRPEDLGQSLSPAVLRRLDLEAQRGRARGVNPAALPPKKPRPPAWVVGTVFLLLGLGLVLWLLWK